MKTPAPNIEISPSEVQEQLARGGGILFVDVRELWEFQTARIEGSTLIPLREIPAHVERLAGAQSLVLFCHHGMRSLDAASWLRAQGIQHAQSMAGGIDRWSLEIDPRVPRY
jgi:rhodanese-related sulfurtransferase